MAAQTLFDVLKLFQNPFSVGMFKAIATSDELFPLLPWVFQAGSAVEYTREKALPTPGFLADTHTSVNTGETTQEVVTVPKREMQLDVHLRNVADLFAGSVNRNTQLIGGFKAMGRLIAQKFMTGAFATNATLANDFQGGPYVDSVDAMSAGLDSNRYGAGIIKYTHTGTYIAFQAPGDKAFGPNVAAAGDGQYTIYSHNPNKWITVTLDISDATADMQVPITFTSTSNEFDGLPKLVSPSREIASSGTNGDDPSLLLLDQMIDAVKVRENLVFFMPAAIRRKYAALFRAMGGADKMSIPNSPVTVEAYRGCPLLTNDWIPVTESKGAVSTLSSIYLASLSPEEGVRFVAPGGTLRQQVNLDPRRATVGGFQVKDLGQLESISAQGVRLLWYGALALGSDLAAVRAKEITTV